jgi:hypothetical protein
VVPVGRRLHADPFDGDELALHAEQTLDDALGFVVATLTEVLVADDAVRVDEVERRPVVVREGAPGRVVVVLRNRVSRCPAPPPPAVMPSMSCSNENSGVWNSNDEQPVVAMACDHARTYGSRRSQLMHVSVQKFTSTTWLRSSAGPSCPELTHPVAPSRDGMCTRWKTLI